MKKRWTLPFGLGLLVLAIAGVTLIPAVASAEEHATSHDHAAHAAGLADELAQVRAATARSTGWRRRSRPGTSSGG
jgi:hypothetical protein